MEALLAPASKWLWLAASKGTTPCGGLPWAQLSRRHCGRGPCRHDPSAACCALGMEKYVYCGQIGTRATSVRKTSTHTHTHTPHGRRHRHRHRQREREREKRAEHLCAVLCHPAILHLGPGDGGLLWGGRDAAATARLGLGGPAAVVVQHSSSSSPLQEKKRFLRSAVKIIIA